MEISEYQHQQKKTTPKTILQSNTEFPSYSIFENLIIRVGVGPVVQQGVAGLWLK
jgi:hypothetical protein